MIKHFVLAFGNSADWDSPNVWRDGPGLGDSVVAAPDADDRAVIPNGKTCNIDSAAVSGSLDVQGTLNIEAGQSLTLSNSTDLLAALDDSVVDGTVNLQGAGSQLKFVTNDHIFTGDGDIFGQDAAAEIEIALGVRFTTQVDITGELLFDVGTGSGDAVFDNQAVVWSNVDTIEFAAGLDLDDSGTEANYRWKVGDDSVLATLLFRESATGLVTSFETVGEDSESSIELDDGVTITTTGGVQMACGTWLRAPNADFNTDANDWVGTCPMPTDGDVHDQNFKCDCSM
jgi:hypothetical protein